MEGGAGRLFLAWPTQVPSSSAPSMYRGQVTWVSWRQAHSVLLQPSLTLPSAEFRSNGRKGAGGAARQLKHSLLL